MTYLKWAIACMAVLFCLSAVADNVPEQIRIQMTGDGRYSITYTTDSSAKDEAKKVKGVQGVAGTNVYFGTNEKSLTQVAKGTSTKFEYLKYSAIIHTVELPKLQDNTQYYYQVGDKNLSDALSDVYSLNTAAPQTWAVFGDYGVTNEEKSYDALMEDADNGVFQGVLHVGDIAYDLHNAHGGRGDEFLNSLQDISANMPYMTCAGNHEKEGNFSHYNARFSANEILGRNSKSNTGLWYSFDIPYAHIIAIDTEVYQYFPDPVQQQRQLQWIKQDLELANTRRDKYPWVIMIGHKCDWQDGVKFADFRALANGLGVDLYICGHQHNYQRLYPGLRKQVQVYDDPNRYVNPKYWIQMVVGSPGCQEKISSGIAPYDDGIAAYFLSYGYGLLRVINGTHLEWKWKQTHSGSAAKAADETAAKMIKLQNLLQGDKLDKPQIKDEMVVIQHNHGPRA